jgi:YqaJ-like viral recombinase domain
MKAATTKTKAPPQDSVEFFYDVDQLSDEWHAIRRGTITASGMHNLLAGGEGKMRAGYMRQLAGERLTGLTTESYSNNAMARGREMEIEARDWYSRTRLVDCTKVGFVKRTILLPLGGEFAIGASPDSQVGPHKGLEIKTMRPDLLIGVLERGAAGVPAEHRAQVQGTMLVCDWDEMDLLLFYRGMPANAVFTIVRDDTYIGQLRNECERFDFEVRGLVEKIRKMA